MWPGQKQPEQTGDEVQDSELPQVVEPENLEAPEKTEEEEVLGRRSSSYRSTGINTHFRGREVTI